MSTMKLTCPLKRSIIVKVICCGFVLAVFYLFVELKTSIPAIYIPSTNEIPTHPIWDNAQISCKGKPFNIWGAPGTYLYKNVSGRFFVMTLHPGELIPNLGVDVPDMLSVTGIENLKTNFGVFQATRLSVAGNYSILTGRFDYVQGSYERSEWYVCGYGLLKLTSSDSGAKVPGSNAYTSRKNLVLLSFTPFTTNESHVRYILTDIQLGRIARKYRANIMDEETSEALRRWDVGVRVKNINVFARKRIKGQWLVVYAGTENLINGPDVTLTMDSQGH